MKYLRRGSLSYSDQVFVLVLEPDADDGEGRLVPGKMLAHMPNFGWHAVRTMKHETRVRTRMNAIVW
jgi:hypothetical protein